MKGKIKKFTIKTLGCKVNQADSRMLKKLLIEAGYEVDDERPDVAIINTCAVTKNAIKKDRRMLNGLKTKHPNAKFVLMGCFPQTHKKEAGKFGVDLVWGTGNLDDLVENIKELVGEDISVCTYICTYIEKPISGERSRYFLKIQDGCEQFCSYCIIPYSRGKLWSRPEKDIFQEIEGAIKAGFSEIVLCGIHLGLYGKEKDAKSCNLTDLLKKIIKIPKICRVRLSSIEANDITKELLSLMESSEKICNHLHIPLQSGTNNILKAMNRPYDTEFFKKTVSMARDLMDDIAITTDVIVGFPGETDQEFSQTEKFIREIAFSKLHVFPFSAHEKTSAAQMKQQVSSEKKAWRALQLRKLSEEAEKNFKMKFIGKKVSFIVEKASNNNIQGKEEHYFDVTVKNTDNRKPSIGALHTSILE